MRKRLITAFTGLALATTIGLVPSTTAYAEPDIDTVQARVDRLYHEAEQASERYNDAKIELEALQGDVASLRADQRRQDAALDTVREQVADAMVSQYQGQGISAVGEIFVSDDPGAFLSQLTTMSSYQDRQDALLADYTDEVEALDIRETATSRRLAQVTALKDRLADEKATVDKKHEEAEGLLGRLKEEERAEMLSRGSKTVPSDVPATGRASAAVAYAMAQVGDSYVYGAAGPSAFDCSGLTMMAWAQAGVALPHSSSAQYSSGPRVSLSALQPGDLVFYYSPISHVGMYIGNGLIVHAANPGAGVKVSDMNEMPVVGAVRPG
ncbi:NlpC/P60 family protein [Nocardioides sp. cx-169]|uniref:C40 family peptidase n=1 Tax=Nocardioides sp. cx-169 TaxID=2899080 RepID=UPI001E3E51B0|nr:C40 family peptidase [Nocardioides sp. cx-169]MCD4534681.1 NlpC/P60 family protein [Nocardioides sp. cx-169]